MGNVAQSSHCRCLCSPICSDSEKSLADDLEWDTSRGALQGGNEAQKAKRVFASSSSVFRSTDVALDDEADPLGIEAALVHPSLLPMGMSGQVAVSERVEESEGESRLASSPPELTDGFCEGTIGEENALDLNGTDRDVQLVFSLNGGLAELHPVGLEEGAVSSTNSPRLRTVSFGSEDESFAGFQELAPKVEGRYQDDPEGNEMVMEEKVDSIGRQMHLQGFKRVKGVFV